MLEEHRVGDQSGNRYHPPSGQPVKPLRQILEIGDAGARQSQCVEAAQKGLAGAALEHLRLARIEAVPDGMFAGRVGLPILRDRPVGTCSGRRIEWNRHDELSGFSLDSR